MQVGSRTVTYPDELTWVSVSISVQEYIENNDYRSFDMCHVPPLVLFCPLQELKVLRPLMR